MKKVRIRNDWKGQARINAQTIRDLQGTLDRAHSAIRLSNTQHQEKDKKIQQLEQQARNKLVNELGHMMECNAKLAEAAARIISPMTH